MSENHATFRRYLIQGLEALQDVKAKSG
jgi:hypothetical protein